MDVAIANWFYSTGMRRSGNHAIQLWLMGLCPPPVIKLNFCPIIRGKPYEQFCEQYDGEKISLVQGAEDYIVKDPSGELNITADNHKRVVIVRNPVNLYRYKLHRKDVEDVHVPKFLQTWVLYAREFLCMTDLVSHKVPLNFDRWFTECEYRMELAVLLEVPFDDKNLNVMDTRWGGSSYDGFKYQGKAQEMDICGRWKQFAGQPRFMSFMHTFRMHEAWDLFLKIFTELPDGLREDGTRC